MVCSWGSLLLGLYADLQKKLFLKKVKICISSGKKKSLALLHN
jgi:hypothetical protein